MGMFDSVWVPCPRCGRTVEAQSKSGPCLLGNYYLNTAPEDVLRDVNRHAPFYCRKCDTQFQVDVTQRVTHLPGDTPRSDNAKKNAFMEGLMALCEANNVRLEWSPDFIEVKSGFSPGMEQFRWKDNDD